MKQVYADFSDRADDGSLPLTSASSVASIAELTEALRDREEVCFTDGERFAVGRVHRRADGTWEGRALSDLVHLPPPGLDEPGATLRRVLFPEAPATEAAAAPPYRPKPPLWRSLPEKHVSPVAIVLGTVGVVGLMGALGAVAFEHQFFSGPATATAVTITAVERTDPADDDSPSRIVYVVKLPDGRTAYLASERAHRPGTRLIAMVSRGGLTGRMLVAPPYVVMPDE